MEYICSVCSQRVPGDMVLYIDHTQKHIMDLIKHDHPDWGGEDGVCKPCVEYYQKELHGSFFKDAPCAIRRRKVKNFLEKITGFFKAK